MTLLEAVKQLGLIELEQPLVFCHLRDLQRVKAAVKVIAPLVLVQPAAACAPGQMLIVRSRMIPFTG